MILGPQLAVAHMTSSTEVILRQFCQAQIPGTGVDALVLRTLAEWTELGKLIVPEDIAGLLPPEKIALEPPSLVMPNFPILQTSFTDFLHLPVPATLSANEPLHEVINLPATFSTGALDNQERPFIASIPPQAVNQPGDLNARKRNLAARQAEHAASKSAKVKAPQKKKKSAPATVRRLPLVRVD